MKCIRLWIGLLALLVCVQVAGPWGWNADAGEGIVRQGVLIPFEITGPEGWIYDVQPHKYVLGVFRPEDDDLYPYISLTVSGGALQLNTTGETIKRDNKPEDLVEANIYSRPGARLLSSNWLGEEGNEYLLAEFSWSSVLGKIRCIKAFHPWMDSVLVVTAVCLAAEFDEYQQIFLDSVSSVRVKTYLDEKERGKASARDVSDDAWLYGDQ